MNTPDIIAHPINNEQIETIKAFFKALKIKFEVAPEKPYNPEFVKKIELSRQELKEGKITRVKKEDIHSFLGL